MKNIDNEIKDFIKSGALKEARNNYKELNKMRKAFVKEYNQKKIESLVLDEYVIGKHDINGVETFCYCLEVKLSELGSIRGGSIARDKFGLYFGKTKIESKKKYRTNKKWSKSLDVEEGFENIKKSIVRLLKDGKNDNYQGISKNIIPSLLKGKILSTYYPQKYLSVFSDKHLDFFLNELPIEFDVKRIETQLDKQKLLIGYKQTHPILRKWNNYEFAKFLYVQYTESSYDETVEYVENQNIELISFNYQKKTSSKPKTKVKKVNYEERVKRNRSIGLRGEKLIFSYEKERLEKAGRVDLAKKVKHVSLKDDSLGYDIKSYDEDGNELHIEVKSTSRKPSSIDFFISHNEYIMSQKDDKYMIYILYDVNSKTPKLHCFDKELLTENMTPVSYRVNLGVKSK